MKTSWGWRLAALAFVAWPLVDGTVYGQRGERGGGDRGGVSQGGGGDGDRGSGRSFSRGGGDRSFSGSGRTFSQGGPERSLSGSRSRESSPGFGEQRIGGPGRPQGRDGSGSARSWSPSQWNSPSQSQFSRGQGERGAGGQQRSFYRGAGDADGRRSRELENRPRDLQSRDSADFDRQRNQLTRDLDSQSDRKRDREQFYPDRDNRINRGRDRDDRFARDRDDDRDRGDFDRDRGGRDRDRDWERTNWDRNDWSRFGGGRNGWGWGGNNIRRSWWNYGWAGNMPFSYGWWDPYYGAEWPVYSPFRYSRWRNQPYYWYTWTPAARLGSALVFGWDRPRYWGYGPGANIYYQDDYVYYDGRRTIPVDDYYQQIYNLAHSVPNISEAEGKQMEWNPLGVFALQRADESESSRAMQLAVSNDGVITGTYFNRDQNQVHPLSGMVDERTQRAAWAFADGQQKALVFETSVYNLTRDESTMMVHFGPSEADTEVWQLVRLEKPDSSAGASGEAQTRLP